MPHDPSDIHIVSGMPGFAGFHQIPASMDSPIKKQTLNTTEFMIERDIP